MARDPPPGVVARARALVGTPFRLHGRDVGGVDCVGLVALAHGREAVPTGYALRTADAVRVEAGLAAAGFVRGDVPAAGDIVIMRTGPAQLHLGVWTGDGLIHADAALRCVVETPGLPWAAVSFWRT